MTKPCVLCTVIASSLKGVASATRTQHKDSGPASIAGNASRLSTARGARFLVPCTTALFVAVAVLAGTVSALVIPPRCTQVPPVRSSAQAPRLSVLASAMVSAPFQEQSRPVLRATPPQCKGTGPCLPAVPPARLAMEDRTARRRVPLTLPSPATVTVSATCKLPLGAACAKQVTAAVPVRSPRLPPVRRAPVFTCGVPPAPACAQGAPWVPPPPCATATEPAVPNSQVLAPASATPGTLALTVQ